MNILVLGSGGREHALAWKIAQSPQCRQVYLHPGNAGTRQHRLPALFEGAGDLETIVENCKAKDISLIVIGPEALLAEGFADHLRAAGFNVVGPGKNGAQLETSKIFAKEFMVRAGIPTAPFQVIQHAADFEASYRNWSYPAVLKLDGLAAGKGVVVATSPAEAKAFADRIWQTQEFGTTPQLFMEGFIAGVETSIIGLCDGKNFLQLSSATDYKRVGEGNTGPNTGGMGCISPSPYLTPEIQRRIDHDVIARVLAQMAKDGMDYRGALYLGIMIDAAGTPFVLEFNARFGDPETQSLMLRLDSDFVDLLRATGRGALATVAPPRWKSEVAVYVVAAAPGYPGKLTVGDPIDGVERVGNGAQVFFSGVSEKLGRLTTAGGRVLGVGALGNNFASARKIVYENLNRIAWPGLHRRGDIGAGFEENS